MIDAAAALTLQYGVLFGILGSGLSAAQILLGIVAFAFAFLIAFVLHEYAHAYAALKSGDPSAKMAGRLSLNPIRHIEPMGLVSFMLVGFGWGKPVPVNPFNYKNFRKGNFWVSISGVLTNLILGIVFGLCYCLIYKYGDLGNLGIFMLGYFFMYGTVLNFFLMIFNLLPIPPLDGYNMLVSFTKPNNRFMAFMRQNAMWMLLAIFVVLMVTSFVGVGLGNAILRATRSFWGLIF